MAGGTNLPAANWHAYAPSAAETTILGNMPNIPGATSLLAGYGAENQMAQGAYDAQRQQAVEAAQAQQGIVNNQEQQKILTDQLKFAASAPGGVEALNSNLYTRGALGGTNLAMLSQGAVDKAAADNTGNAGRGLGAMAQSGFTGLAPAAQKFVGPGVDQGIVPLVQAAQINADSRIGAAQISAAARTAQNGGITITGGTPTNGWSMKTPLLKGETGDQAFARTTGTAQPGTNPATDAQLIGAAADKAKAAGDNRTYQMLREGSGTLERRPNGSWMTKGKDGSYYTINR